MDRHVSWKHAEPCGPPPTVSGLACCSRRSCPSFPRRLLSLLTEDQSYLRRSKDRSLEASARSRCRPAPQSERPIHRARLRRRAGTSRHVPEPRSGKRGRCYDLEQHPREQRYGEWLRDGNTSPSPKASRLDTPPLLRDSMDRRQPSEQPHEGVLGEIFSEVSIPGQEIRELNRVGSVLLIKVGGSTSTWGHGRLGCRNAQARHSRGFSSSLLTTYRRSRTQGDRAPILKRRDGIASPQ